MSVSEPTRAILAARDQLRRAVTVVLMAGTGARIALAIEAMHACGTHTHTDWQRIGKG